jgi:hypothetical protein
MYVYIYITLFKNPKTVFWKNLKMRHFSIYKKKLYFLTQSQTGSYKLMYGSTCYLLRQSLNIKFDGANVAVSF